MKQIIPIVLLCWCGLALSRGNAQDIKTRVINILKDQDIKEAEWALKQLPITVTAETCSRSAGGKHDFYSEGDYWWPDPASPGGAYIQRDGLSNPENFTAHRLAMIRFSKIIGSLASAFLITHDEKYIKHALVHLKAWFIDEETNMNPNLQFAQAIKGKATGRSIGIIDTIHLMEVAQGVLVMSPATSFDAALRDGVVKWFRQYLEWLTTHPYGIEEMNAKNNHGTCWTMQVAAFAKLTGQKEILNVCVDRYKNILLPDQMDSTGSFPLELKRTKPYGYSIFNLDAMTMICQILSTKENDLWYYQTLDKTTILNGIRFLYPYIDNKNKWPFPKDVMYWANWPVAQPALVFGAVAFQNTEWLQTWQRLEHDPEAHEVVRNLPVRHPIIWLNE
jgi:hypothetical protein